MSSNLTESQIERRLESVLAWNGYETMRQTAKRLGIGTTTVYDFMRRRGYRPRQVTRWERGPSELPDNLSKTGDQK